MDTKDANELPWRDLIAETNPVAEPEIQHEIVGGTRPNVTGGNVQVRIFKKNPGEKDRIVDLTTAELIEWIEDDLSLRQDPGHYTVRSRGYALGIEI